MPHDLICAFRIQREMARDVFTCNTVKANVYSCELKCKTRGLEIGCTNCGVVVGYKELYGSESLSQVALFLLDIFDSYDNSGYFNLEN